MKNNLISSDPVKGHISAAVTILIWGTTFISTKILLQVFTPAEILFTRFLIGFILLCIVWPHIFKTGSFREELLLALAGLCGVTLYYLLENIALTHTLASNVGVIVSIAPFFTGLFAYLFLKEEKPGLLFFIGFLLAIAGITLINFNGTLHLGLNPAGDILATAAAVIWAVYSILTRKISALGYGTLQTTRRIFLYGLLFMLPALFFMDFQPDLSTLKEPTYLFNILFLGIAASGLCFVTWNFAVKKLGAVKTSVYIYLVPLITIVTSVIVLKEVVTGTTAAGAGLTVAGLFLSEYKSNKKGV